MNDYNFGNFVCMLREKKGLTQADVAGMLGVTAAAVSKWENGSSKPRVEVLFKLAEILEVRPEELIAGHYIIEGSELSAEGDKAIKNYKPTPLGKKTVIAIVCAIVAAMILMAGLIVGIVFAAPVSAAVAGSSEQAAEIAARSFRAQLIVFPVMSWVFLCNMMLQTIGMTFRATIVAMARQGLAFIPCVLLLPLVIRALGGNALDGLVWAQSVADLFAFVIALPIGIMVLKELKVKWEKKQSGLLLEQEPASAISQETAE